MGRLLRIEFQKLFYYRTFWVILGAYLLLFAPTAYALESIVNSININGQQLSESGITIFNFPDIWYNLAYLAGWFKLILAVLVIILVTNEYNFRTLRQNIIDGMSKWEVIMAKEMVIVIISLIAVVYLAIVTILLGKGPGPDLTQGSKVMFASLLALFLYLNIAYLIASLFNRSGLAIGLLILYSLLIENLLSWRLPDAISEYLPMNTIDRLTPNPFAEFAGKEVSVDLSLITILVCLAYLVVISGLIRWRLNSVSK